MRTENQPTTTGGGRLELTSAGLHVIAMVSMLIDHTLKTVVESNSNLIVLGRLAFPIFAFMTAEGYLHTRNFHRYALRMLLFALLSEIPYDLMKGGSAFDSYDQNVIWTFLLALLAIRAMDCALTRWNNRIGVLAAVLAAFAGIWLGVIFMVDYSGAGVLMVLMFYLFRKRNWRNIAITVALMTLINIVALGAFDTDYTVTLAGRFVTIPLQGFAMLSLIPIWLYRGRQGYHSKPFQYLCYAFYPVHMLVLVLIGNYIAR